MLRADCGRESRLQMPKKQQFNVKQIVHFHRVSGNFMQFVIMNIEK